MIKLRWVSIDSSGPQPSQSTKAPAWQVKPFTAGLKSTICVETFHQQSHRFGESAQVHILRGENHYWHRSCSPFLKRGLWHTPHQQLKTALSILAILEGPEGLRCMVGWRITITYNRKKHRQLGMIDVTSLLSASSQWVTLPTNSLSWMSTKSIYSGKTTPCTMHSSSLPTSSGNHVTFVSLTHPWVIFN